MLMPGGARPGSARCSAALNEPLRSEPQIETTFTLSAMINHSGWLVPAEKTSALVLDRILQNPDAFDLDLAGIAVAHPRRRLARMRDAGWRAREDQVARLERD